ncbi:hypothetical protein Tco_0304552 [Tanacetum coccineum]
MLVLLGTHLAEVSTQEPIVVEISVSSREDWGRLLTGGMVREDESAHMMDSRDDDDDDVDEYFLKDVDVINADGFDSDPSNDEERNYKKRSSTLLLPKEAPKVRGLNAIPLKAEGFEVYKNDQCQCLGDDIDLHPNSNFTFISDRQKLGRDEVRVSCGQATQGIVMWRGASAQHVRILKSVEAKSDFIAHTTSVRSLMENSWRKQYSHKLNQFIRPSSSRSLQSNIYLPPKHLVQVGRTKRTKEKRQRNIGHNKATCKGQGRKATIGRNNAEGSGLSVAAGEGGAGDTGGAGVATKVHPILDGQGEEYKQKESVHKKGNLPTQTCKSTFYQFSSCQWSKPGMQMERTWVMVYQHSQAAVRRSVA